MSESVLAKQPLVSIVINNYNYDRFLAKAIDSALNQTYAPIEVIVVDDGSTDGSRDVLNRYARHIIPVFKSNGGQASAINEGVKAAAGEIICFLDADDLFEPEKVERVVDLFQQERLVDLPIILHNQFAAIDSDDKDLGLNLSAEILAFPAREAAALSQFVKGYNAQTFFTCEIDRVCQPDRVYEFARRYRYVPYLGMPTSSISMSRKMANLLFPLPVNGSKISADELIVKGSALIGEVYTTNLALTRYRLHGSNHWYGRSMTKAQEELANLEGDKYFNSKLKLLGKQPVFCFPQSIPAAAFYRHYFGKASGSRLISLAINVIRWHLDYTTLKFSAETFGRGLYYQLINIFADRTERQ